MQATDHHATRTGHLAPALQVPLPSPYTTGLLVPGPPLSIIHCHYLYSDTLCSLHHVIALPLNY